MCNGILLFQLTLKMGLMRTGC